MPKMAKNRFVAPRRSGHSARPPRPSRAVTRALSRAARDLVLGAVDDPRPCEEVVDMSARLPCWEAPRDPRPRLPAPRPSSRAARVRRSRRRRRRPARGVRACGGRRTAAACSRRCTAAAPAARRRGSGAARARKRAVAVSTAGERKGRGGEAGGQRQPRRTGARHHALDHGRAYLRRRGVAAASEAED